MSFIPIPDDRAEAFAARWQKRARAQAKAAVEAGAPKSLEKADRSVLSDLPLSVHWGYNLFVHERGTLISASFGKSEDKVWGKGVNVMIVHTLLEHRGRGLAKGAYRALMAHAAERATSASPRPPEATGDGEPTTAWG